MAKLAKRMREALEKVEALDKIGESS